MPPRKRKRSQAFTEDDDEDTDRRITNEPFHSDIQPSNGPDKERDVWDSFREEHFEAVDQMPLTLHRHYALMQELDQQAHSYIAQLLPTLQRYISKRRGMAGHPGLFVVTDRSNSGSFISLTSPDDLSLPCLESISGRLSTSERLQVASPTTQNIHSESQRTTQRMLSQIASFADELFRASEEKVNLAQAALDSVDRHVRILDQAIKEQEASISSTAKPSHLAPSTLPELVMPRWARCSRTTLSPVDGDNDLAFAVGEAESPGPLFDEITPHAHALRRSGKKGRLSVLSRQREGSMRTITLPVQPGPSSGLIDSPEQLFCYCTRVSFGEMVACDNEKCEIEWFHVECLGLKETPKGTWYCSHKCRASARKRK